MFDRGCYCCMFVVVVDCVVCMVESYVGVLYEGMMFVFSDVGYDYVFIDVFGEWVEGIEVLIMVLVFDMGFVEVYCK